MHRFTDAEGREWSVSATIGSLRRVKDGAEVDLTDPKSVAAIGSDPWKFAAVLTELVGDQLDGAGVTPEAFVDALDGPTIEAATEAILAELVNFTHSRQRPAMETMLAKKAQLETRAVETLKTLYSGGKLDEALDRHMAATEADILRLSTFGSGPTASPASSVSTPTPSPSASLPPGPKPE